MSTLYSTGASLGPSYAGQAVGYRQVALDGTITVPFTTAGVAATTIAGNYTVAGGMPVPFAPVRIVWGTAGADLAQELFTAVGYAPNSYPTLASLGPFYTGQAVGYRLMDASGVVAAFTTAGVAETTEPGDYAVVVPLPAGFTGRVVYGTATLDLAEEWVQTVPAVGRGPAAAGFFQALVSWFAADPVCAAACPGGLVNAESAPDQVVPYARLWEREDAEPVSPDDREVEAAFSFYATDDNAGNSGDAPARAAGVAVTNRILAGQTRDAWSFLEEGEVWQDAGCLWVPPGTVAVAGKARDGRRVWRYDAWFKFFLVRPG